MKITIVGGGNAGCLTALFYSYFSQGKSKIELELIYDPKKPPELVGQATLVTPPKLLWQALGVDWLHNNIKATPKLGIIYKGWGKTGKDISSPFAMSALGIHYSPHEMRQAILESGFFKVTEGEVKDLNDLDADYIFDCRGRPEDLSNYLELKNPLNAAILAKPKQPFDKHYPYTHAVATPDGWTFEIPTFEDSVSYPYSIGYLYNSEITPYEEARQNFTKQFDVSITKGIGFQNYVAKDSLVDERIILGGNRQFFLEPLESTSIEAYLQWANLTFHTLFSDYKSFPEISDDFFNMMIELQNYILWRYSFGSIYDTPFWKHAKEMKYYDPKLDLFLKVATVNPWREITYHDELEKIPGYGQWSPWHAKKWLDDVEKNVSV